MPGRLAGKTAFVTAAAQGIGHATALAFAAEGAHVIATDMQADKLQELSRDGIRAFRLDVTDQREVDAAAIEAGRVDILFNAAGVVHQGTILDASDADWDAAFAVNVRGMARVIRAFLPGMLDRGGGAIINIASVAGSIKGVLNRAVYGATKAAVIGLTKAVAADFISHGVRCNCICPGTVASPSLEARMAADAARTGVTAEEARQAYVARQPMGRLGVAEEMAALAVYLASDDASFMTGQAVVIDGGFTL